MHVWGVINSTTYCLSLSRYPISPTHTSHYFQQLSELVIMYSFTRGCRFFRLTRSKVARVFALLVIKTRLTVAMVSMSPIVVVKQLY